MKKRNVFILIIAGVIALLIITKPSDEACKNHYSSDAKNMVKSQYFGHPNSKYKIVQLSDLVPVGVALKSADELANSEWQLCIGIKDYILVKKISIQYIDEKSKETHFAILNTFF